MAEPEKAPKIALKSNASSKMRTNIDVTFTIREPSPSRHHPVSTAKIPPMIAITHIQNTGPNPPIQIADEPPTIFPIPTRDAVETISA